MVKALEVSCNYYFFTVADRLGIDLINKWCSKLGLDSLTGLEIPGETAGQIGGQKVLFDNTKENIGTGVARLVFNQLVRQLRGYCEKLEKEVDDAALETCAEKLLRIIDDREVSEWKSDILRIMREDLGIAETVTNNNYWHAEIYSILLELRWNPNQTVRTGIGQAVVSVTQLQSPAICPRCSTAARYTTPPSSSGLWTPPGRWSRRRSPSSWRTWASPRRTWRPLKRA